MNRKLLAHLALIAVALLYGGNYIIAKQVMHKDILGPLGFVMLRIISGTILFWLLFLSTVRQSVARRDLPRLALCGFLGVAVNQSLFFSGLKLTTPIHASLIMTSTPILVLIASHFILNEKITPRKLLGIFLACIGAVLLLTSGESLSFAKNTVLGDAMVLINAVSYGLYLVFVKKLVEEYHPFTVITWVSTFGLLFIIPVGSYEFFTASWSSFDGRDWLFISYVLIGVSFMAYLFNIIALKEVTPSVVSIYIYLQPLFATILSLIIYHETMDALKIASGSLIFLGVYMVSIRKKANLS